MGDLRLGTSRPDALYAGSQAVDKVMVGTTQVWQPPGLGPVLLTYTPPTQWDLPDPGEYGANYARVAFNSADLRVQAGDWIRATNNDTGEVASVHWISKKFGVNGGWDTGTNALRQPEARVTGKFNVTGQTYLFEKLPGDPLADPAPIRTWYSQTALPYGYIRTNFGQLFIHPSDPLYVPASVGQTLVLRDAQGGLLYIGQITQVANSRLYLDPTWYPSGTPAAGDQITVEVVPSHPPVVVGHSWFYTDVTSGSVNVPLPVTTQAGDYIAVHARRGSSISPSLWPDFETVAINPSRDLSMVKLSNGGESSLTITGESGGLIASVWVVRNATYVSGEVGTAQWTPAWGAHDDTLYLTTEGTHDTDGPVGGSVIGSIASGWEEWDNAAFDYFYNSDMTGGLWALMMAKGELVGDPVAPRGLNASWAGDLGSVHARGLITGFTRRWDALDKAILNLNPTHYWRLDDGVGPFEDYGSNPVPLTIDTDNGIVTEQTVAEKLTGISMPLGTVLRGVGCIPDSTVSGETYLLFTDVNDTTAAQIAGTSVDNASLRLNTQYATGVGFFPNWRITGTNRNPSPLATTGVPAMFAGYNNSSGGGRTFSEVEYPTGSGNGGAQGYHSYAGLDLLVSARGTAGSVNVARIAVFDQDLANTANLQPIFDAYVNL